MNNSYDNSARINTVKSILSATPVSALNPKGKVIITSLDDVFKNFDILVNSHPEYVSNNIDVKSYLNSKVKDVLNNALNDRNSFDVDDVCFKVAKFLSPKNYGFFKRKKEEYSLGFALRSLIKQYELSQIN